MSMSNDSSISACDDDDFYYSTTNSDNSLNYSKRYPIKPGLIIGPNLFKISTKLGSGSFGQIFLGQSLVDADTMVAIKFEPIREWSSSQLSNEKRIYELVGQKEGFPQMFWFGQYSLYNVIVIELLGKNLEDVFQMCSKQFSLKTIAYLALQLLNRFEFIHSINIAYRDVKPENFLLGYPGSKNQNIVHVVDFGLSKEYIDGATGQHIPFREGKNLTGTARYMSINSHLGVELSRRDDLESLAHLFIYFLREGKLPWSGLKAKTLKERYKKIAQCKQNITPNELCKGFPKVFPDFLNYTRGLQFDQDPDYAQWKNKFSILFNDHQDDQSKFEWEDKFIQLSHTS